MVAAETGQGDSEVLWVEDSRILYRCGCALYGASIEGVRLVDRRKLLERDFIADVHWAFYGPPSPAPPNPPWTPFPVEQPNDASGSATEPSFRDACWLKRYNGLGAAPTNKDYLIWRNTGSFANDPRWERYNYATYQRPDGTLGQNYYVRDICKQNP